MMDADATRPAHEATEAIWVMNNDDTNQIQISNNCNDEAPPLPPLTTPVGAGLDDHRQYWSRALRLRLLGNVQYRAVRRLETVLSTRTTSRRPDGPVRVALV